MWVIAHTIVTMVCGDFCVMDNVLYIGTMSPGPRYALVLDMSLWS